MGLNTASRIALRTLIGLLTVALVGCAPAAPPSPTAAPAGGQAKPTEAAQAAPAAQPTSAPAAAPAQQAAPAQAGGAAQAGGQKTIVIGMTHDFKTFDPDRVYETFGGMAVYAIYEPLLQFEGEDLTKPKPLIASEWQADPSGKLYTFTLRDGVKFASGNPLTSADVKFSFDRLKNIKGQGSFLADNITGVEAPDPKTVKVTLKNVDPAFLGMMGRAQYAIVDSKLAKEHGATSEPGSDQSDKAEGWFLMNSAGSGPYVLKEYVPKDRLVLDRNPSYWGKAPPVDRVILKNIEDPATQKLTLEKGDIDIAFDLTTDQIKALDTSKGVKAYNARSLTQLFAYFNMDPQIGGPVSNLDVQRAIRSAIDYDGLVELIGGGAIKLPSIIQLGFLGALGPDAAPKTDLDKAKQFLAKGGYPNGFKITLEVGSTEKTGGVAHLTLAQKLQADLSKIGVNIEISTLDNNLALDKYRNGQTPMGSRGWNPDYPDALNQLAFGPGEKVGLRVNWKAEADPELSQLVKQAQVELDETKRAEMLKQIQLLIMDRGPYANLLQPGRQIGLRHNIEGVLYNPVYHQSFVTLDKK